MKLIDILSGINPILRILLIIVLTVAAHFAVKAIRRFSRYLLTMKVDSEAALEASLTRKYPKIATIITILVSAVTFTIYFVAVGMVQHRQGTHCWRPDRTEWCSCQGAGNLKITGFQHPHGTVGRLCQIGSDQVKLLTTVSTRIHL